MKFPISVEKLAPGRLQPRLGRRLILGRKWHGRGARGLFVDSENRLVFPIRLLGERREGEREGDCWGLHRGGCVIPNLIGNAAQSKSKTLPIQ